MGMPSIQLGTGSNSSVAPNNLTPESLSSASTEALQSMISNPSLSIQDKQSVLGELARRAKESEASSEESGKDGGEDSIGDLLNKLTSGEPLTDEQLQKLAKALGVNPSDLKALAGQGGGTSQAGTTPQGGGDIH